MSVNSMVALRDEVLRALHRNYRERKAAGQEPLLCEYIRRKDQNAFRVKTKELFIGFDRGVVGQSEIFEFMAKSLLGERKLQKLYAFKTIGPLREAGRARLGKTAAPTSREGDSTNRQINIDIRNELKALEEQGTPNGVVTDDQLRDIAQEMLDNYKEANYCSKLMEYRLDTQMGARAMGSEKDREANRKAAFKACGIRLGGSVDEDALDRAIDDAVDKDAERFLSDAGYSVKKEGPQGVVRVCDVPVDLVELCMQEGLYVPRGAPMSARGKEDVERKKQDTGKLFADLCSEWKLRYEAWASRGKKGAKPEGRDDLVIPVEIDPLSGAGLYLMGSGWFDDTARGRLDEKTANFLDAMPYVYVILYHRFNNAPFVMQADKGTVGAFHIDQFQILASVNTNAVFKFYEGMVGGNAEDSPVLQAYQIGNGGYPAGESAIEGAGESRGKGVGKGTGKGEGCPDSYKMYFEQEGDSF